MHVENTTILQGNCPNSREGRDLEQLQHMLNMEEQDHRSFSTHSSDVDCRSPLKLMNGRDDAATFLPLDFRIGGQSRDSHPTVGTVFNQKIRQGTYTEM